MRYQPCILTTLQGCESPKHTHLPERDPPPPQQTHTPGHPSSLPSCTRCLGRGEPGGGWSVALLLTRRPAQRSQLNLPSYGALLVAPHTHTALIEQGSAELACQAAKHSQLPKPLSTEWTHLLKLTISKVQEVNIVGRAAVLCAIRPFEFPGLPYFAIPPPLPAPLCPSCPPDVL